tara:strand:- start:18 stop:191 length:174 start_codon:yes stop_codon:yes gene_type:complete
VSGWRCVDRQCHQITKAGEPVTLLHHAIKAHLVRGWTIEQAGFVFEIAAHHGKENCG